MRAEDPFGSSYSEILVKKPTVRPIREAGIGKSGSSTCDDSDFWGEVPPDTREVPELDPGILRRAGLPG